MSEKIVCSIFYSTFLVIKMTWSNLPAFDYKLFWLKYVVNIAIGVKSLNDLNIMPLWGWIHLTHFVSHTKRKPPEPYRGSSFVLSSSDSRKEWFPYGTRRYLSQVSPGCHHSVTRVTSGAKVGDTREGSCLKLKQNVGKQEITYRLSYRLTLVGLYNVWNTILILLFLFTGFT